MLKKQALGLPTKPEVQAAREATSLLYSRRSVASEHHSQRNEDLILIDRQRGLAAVFDGVGGCPAGDVAARIAARVIRRGWRRFLHESQPAQRHSLLQCVDHAARARVTLYSLLREAHDQIRTEGPLHPGVAGGQPESTVAIAVFTHAPGDERYCMSYAWVGDSRIYHCRDADSIELLTQDDGILSALIRMHEISQDDALRIDQATYPAMLSEAELRYFELRNGLSQALGDPRPLEVHVQQIEVVAGDRVLLCTDGIHDNMTWCEIVTVFARTRRTTGAKLLVEAALRQSRRDKSAWMRAKPDDMTAVIVTRAT